jgi:hypothetical protein
MCVVNGVTGGCGQASPVLSRENHVGIEIG